MRLIDANVLREEVNSWGMNDYEPSDFTDAIENTPTVEAIPKADYENRLATDMVTIKQLSNSVKTLQKANLEIAGAYGKLETDYENRLKADMVSMLTDIQLEIEELQGKYSPYYDEASQHISEIIQQKIEQLKENIDDR